MNKETTIIAADYMYLIFLGREEIIDKIINKLNNDKKTLYIKYEISNPCINLIDDNEIRKIISSEKYIIIDEGVETAQCLTYADISSNNDSTKMMIMMLIDNGSYYKLSFPILQLDEEENPDKLVSKWLISHNISKSDISNITIRPVQIVGTDHDILVFSALINE
jgi:hypothetical protein